jgi:hypothetical protein
MPYYLPSLLYRYLKEVGEYVTGCIFISYECLFCLGIKSKGISKSFLHLVGYLSCTIIELLVLIGHRASHSPTTYSQIANDETIG